jgi:RNA polymerase sigma-70 factor (ECF subfamily)
VAPGNARAERGADGELIERVRNGETRLFAELVHRHQDAVYGMALRFVGSRTEAEDVAQEAFLRAYRGIPGFKGDAKFSTWLYRITFNLCADWLRRNRRPDRAAASIDKADMPADERADLEKGLVVSEERERVRRALDGLEEIYRGVILLLYYQDMSYDQIAEVLGVPLKTVETRLYRARKMLRVALEEPRHGGGQA